MSQSTAPHVEALLQHSIDVIRGKLVEMAELDITALNRAVHAVVDRDRRLAYSVILRDQDVDAAETELDQLCMEFILRHQPAAANLRFVYSASKVVSELERVGDYAESIARQAVLINLEGVHFPGDKLLKMAELSIPMLRNAVRAFVEKDTDLALVTKSEEPQANQARDSLVAELLELRQEGQLPLEALTPLVTVVRRLERVSDQATNICEQALYFATGKDVRHQHPEGFHVLFVDDTDACLPQMAEAIGRSLDSSNFTFSSAGVRAGTVEPRTVSFLIEKGLRVESPLGHSIGNIQPADQSQIVVSLSPDAARSVSPKPSRKLGLQWSVPDPSKVRGTPAQVRAAYEDAFVALRSHIQDLVEAIKKDEGDEN